MIANSTIPDGSPSKDWQYTVCRLAGFEPGTAGLQSSVTTNEPPLLPTTAPSLNNTWKLFSSENQVENLVGLSIKSFLQPAAKQHIKKRSPFFLSSYTVSQIHYNDFWNSLVQMTFFSLCSVVSLKWVASNFFCWKKCIVSSKTLSIWLLDWFYFTSGQDIFKEKLQHARLAIAFPEYAGSQEFEEAK